MLCGNVFDSKNLEKFHRSTPKFLCIQSIIFVSISKFVKSGRCFVTFSNELGHVISKLKSLFLITGT